MASDDTVEVIHPAQVREGDVIKDPAADRWVTVNDIQLLSNAGAGVFSFYDDSPDDRVTFEGDETVQRRKSASQA